ncbi:MAG: hypothetical protein HWN67_18475 [Candidatus Helarchaeota archaeon]|nr:hypothetical protein [Candidatus Helarchaeota archaeon]
MNVRVFTREGCLKCKEFLEFLKKYEISFIEIGIEEKIAVRELMTNEYIIENFCDKNLCIVKTPIVDIDNKWIHEELFDNNNLNEEKAKKIFNIQ